MDGRVSRARWLGALLFAVAAGTAAETGVTDRAIRIGQSAALSGPAAELGREMRLGAQALFEAVNGAGGVAGRRVELVTLDDGYEPNRAADNTRRLIGQDGVFALFGYVGTPTSNAALPIFSEAKVPFFGPFTGAESLRNPFNRYVFHVRASYFDETEKIVQQLISTGVKNIAVFYQDDAYGKAGFAGVEAALKRRGLAVAAAGTVQRNTVEVASAVQAIHSASPGAVVLVSAYASCAEFIRQMKRAGSSAQFFNVSFVGARALAAALGPDGYGVAVSQVVPFPWSPSIPVVREYQKALARHSPDSGYSFTSLEGYLAAKVFVEGLKRAGRDLTRARFIDALEKMNGVDFGGFFVRFAPNDHNGSHFVDLTIIGRDGRFLH